MIPSEATSFIPPPECDGRNRLKDAEDDTSGKSAEDIPQAAQNHGNKAVEGEEQPDGKAPEGGSG